MWLNQDDKPENKIKFMYYPLPFGADVCQVSIQPQATVTIIAVSCLDIIISSTYFTCISLWRNPFVQAFTYSSKMCWVPRLYISHWFSMKDTETNQEESLSLRAQVEMSTECCRYHDSSCPANSGAESDWEYSLHLADEKTGAQSWQDKIKLGLPWWLRW